jgi:hypothetical protein
MAEVDEHELFLKARDGFRRDAAAARFFAHTVEKRGCLLWTGTIDRHGYGRYSNEAAHRHAYELEHGSIPAGKELHHTCRRRACVLFDHLVAVTHKQHVELHADDRRNNGAHWQLTKTHCPQGHAYDEENTLVYQGRRYCRACDRDRKKAKRVARNKM